MSAEETVSETDADAEVGLQNSAPQDDEMSSDDVTNVSLKKSEFLTRVVERSMRRQSDVRPILEAAMAVLGEALDAGEDIQFPPLGKIKHHKAKHVSGHDVIMVKIRRPKSEG